MSERAYLLIVSVVFLLLPSGTFPGSSSYLWPWSLPGRASLPLLSPASCRMKGSTSHGRCHRRDETVARLHKKHQAIRIASVEHTDEELHRRLKCVQQSAAPFFTVCLSEDRKNIISHQQGVVSRAGRCALELKVRRGKRRRGGEAVTCHHRSHLSGCEQPPTFVSTDVDHRSQNMSQERLPEL